MNNFVPRFYQNVYVWVVVILLALYVMPLVTLAGGIGGSPSGADNGGVSGNSNYGDGTFSSQITTYGDGSYSYTSYTDLGNGVIEVQQGTVNNGTNNVSYASYTMTIDGDPSSSGIPTNTTSYCSSHVKPNLTPTDIFFVVPGAVISTNSAVPQTKLQNGMSYEPVAVVTNSGCNNTDFVATDGTTYHVDQLPHGEDGTFPVRLTVDFNKVAPIEITEYVDDQGPIDRGRRIFVRFEAVTMDQDGTHAFTVTVDPTEADAGVGSTCSGAFGCIDETIETDNVRSEDFTVFTPSVTLGSVTNVVFRHVFDTDGEWKYADASTANVREITTGENVGLYWSTVGVSDIKKCTGNGKLNGGSTDTNDFNGLLDEAQGGDDKLTYVKTGGASMPPTSNKSRKDMHIDEPGAGNFHLYTITCPTSGSGFVSDTIIINNGADSDVLDDLVELKPTLNNMVVELGQVITKVPFTTRNTGFADVSTYNYEIKIDGVVVGSNTRSGTLTAGSLHTTNGTISSYTAPSTETVAPHIPIEVCITHPQMATAQCDDAILRVVDTSDEPTITPGSGTPTQTITATPVIIRPGTDVKVSWDPKGGTNCVLSPANLFPGADPNVVTNNYEVSGITGETTLTYDCTGGSNPASVTITVLPSLSET